MEEQEFNFEEFEKNAIEQIKSSTHLVFDLLSSPDGHYFSPLMRKVIKRIMKNPASLPATADPTCPPYETSGGGYRRFFGQRTLQNKVHLFECFGFPNKNLLLLLRNNVLLMVDYIIE